MRDGFDKLGYKKLVEDLPISKKNEQYIRALVKHLQGYSVDSRIIKYEHSLWRFAYLVEKDFDKLTKEEITQAGGIINKGNLSDATKQDTIKEIKRAFKFWFGEDEYYPRQVFGLKAPRSKGKLKLPEDMLSEDEIYGMIKACGNARDQFFIALLGLDGALRPIEARNIKWKDIQKDKYGFFIAIKTAKKSGDKDTRVVRIIKSEPYFVRWNQEYPKEKGSEDLVFINYSDLSPMNDGTIAALFKRLQKKLKFKRRLYPYLLRHSLLTKMSKDPQVPISVLKKFAGHSLASNTIAEYQHFGDDDLKDMQLQINGIVKKEDRKEAERKPIKCPKCGKSNEYDAEFCGFCNMALSQKRMVEAHERFKEIDEKLKESDAKRDALNKMVYFMAKKELKNLKGKDKEEMEETLNLIVEGLK
jgi:integrase